MSESRTASGATHMIASGLGRMIRAWRALPHERRLAAYAALGLFLALFLPWYQRHFFVVVGGRAQPAADTQTAWGAFSFAEAALLLVSAGVLTLLFARAEGRAFHLPGGDGGVITAAGLWACVLVIWRIFDKQSATSHGAQVTTYGIEWGIFVALGVAAFLAYAGSRIRAAHQPEPPLPGEPDSSPAREPAQGPPAARRRVRPPRPVRAADPATPATVHSVASSAPATNAHPDPPTPATNVHPDPPTPATKRHEEPPTRPLADPPPASRPPRTRRAPHSDEQLTMPLDEDD